MAQNTFERLEKKVLINNDLVPDFIRDISDYMEPDVFNKDGEPYMVCNIYFDNDNNDVIRRSVMKPPFKEKLRMRSYGVPDETSTVFIELKRKLYVVGTKRRARITLAQAYRYLNEGIHPENLSYIDSQVLKEIDYFRELNHVYPKVYISYLRNAFYGKEDSSFRVTVDKDIVTRRHDLRLESGRYGELLLPDGKTLLEIKFAGARPLWFSRIMDKYGIIFGTYSKYGSEFQKYTKKQIENRPDYIPRMEASSK